MTPCFVCGRSLRGDRLALAGYASRDRQGATIRFHRACAARLAAEALDAFLSDLDAPAAGAPSLRTGFAESAGLTPRESQILDLVAAGLTNLEIARSIGLHEKTVKNVVSEILSKLGVPNRTQAATLHLQAALRDGYAGSGDRPWEGEAATAG